MTENEEELMGVTGLVLMILSAAALYQWPCRWAAPALSLALGIVYFIKAVANHEYK